VARDPILTVVVTTYEWPEALDVALRALSEEKDEDFEVIVANDGSGPQTTAVIEKWQRAFPVSLVHVRQEDEGSRQARARNLGALHARGSFFVFLDGDCLVRRGFVKAVRRAIVPGWFLASKRLNLSKRLSQRALDDGVPLWRWGAVRWLGSHPRELLAASLPRERNRPGVILAIRDRRRPWRLRQREFTPPHDAYGFFTGVSRQDFSRVNGFEARFVGWGAEDVDMTLRLRRVGLRCGWPGPRATLLHLWHLDRRQRSPVNTPLLRETQSGDRTEAVAGLRELARELARDQVSANRVGSSSESSGPEKR
jgi:glycosyltransferase involved in cell wall biosynthesis